MNVDDLQQAISDHLNEPFQRFYFSFYDDWDSFIFWKPMNWRNFHFINLAIEYNEFKWLDIDFSLLGFNFCFMIFRKIKNDTSKNV